MLYEWIIQAMFSFFAAEALVALPVSLAPSNTVLSAARAAPRFTPAVKSRAAAVSLPSLLVC